MLVVCLNCRRIVGCLNSDGKIIDNCYHCSFRDCMEQLEDGQSIVVEVIIQRFRCCLEHDSPHIGFKQKEGL